MTFILFNYKLLAKMILCRATHSYIGFQGVMGERIQGWIQKEVEVLSLYFPFLFNLLLSLNKNLHQISSAVFPKTAVCEATLTVVFCGVIQGLMVNGIRVFVHNDAVYV